MSTIAMLATSATLGLILGRLAAQHRIRRLDNLLRLANHVAGHDQLTGMPNRYQAAEMFFLRQVRRLPTIIALVDLDRFKHINDDYGHHAGDDLLCAVGERLTDATTREGGEAARLGGDEFLLLLPPGDGEPADAVEPILHALAQPVLLQAGDGIVAIKPEASAGITIYDGDHGTFTTILHQADIALYQAKRYGTGQRTCTYRPDMSMPRNAGRHGPRLREQRPGDDQHLSGPDCGNQHPDGLGDADEPTVDRPGDGEARA